MKSSSGQHFAGLDHLRALAAFLVVLWHFAHRYNDQPVPLAQSPELGLFDEGHNGVALFMTLSGYLFARLVRGRSIDFPAFLWNRALRLLPLLLLVILLAGLLNNRDDPWRYVDQIVKGPIKPTLPNGGWSITAEMHFYILLPLILWGAGRRPALPLMLVAAALAVRSTLLLLGFDVQILAYYTIVGRIDQFLLGIFFASRPASGRLTLLLFGALALFYSWFTWTGGFYGEQPGTVWVVLPTIEGLGFGALISWYAGRPLTGRWMWPVEKAGEYSYAIYLLHYFIVSAAANFVDQKIMRLDSIYVAIPWALVFFAYMTLLGWVSYRFVESPFLKMRRPYLRPACEEAESATLAAPVPAPELAPAGLASTR